MSKSCNAGALITPVYFKRIVRETDSEVSMETEVNVFDGDKPAMCEWINAHGTEAWRTMQLNWRAGHNNDALFAKLNDPTLIVYKADDPNLMRLFN